MLSFGLHHKAFDQRQAGWIKVELMPVEERPFQPQQTSSPIHASLGL